MWIPRLMPFLFLRPAKFFTSIFPFGSEFCKLIIHFGTRYFFLCIVREQQEWGCSTWEGELGFKGGRCAGQEEERRVGPWGRPMRSIQYLAMN